MRAPWKPPLRRTPLLPYWTARYHICACSTIICRHQLYILREARTGLLHVLSAAFGMICHAATTPLLHDHDKRHIHLITNLSHTSGAHEHDALFSYYANAHKPHVGHSHIYHSFYL